MDSTYIGKETRSDVFVLQIRKVYRTSEASQFQIQNSNLFAGTLEYLSSFDLRVPSLICKMKASGHVTTLLQIFTF